ncbi:precorrin-6Y C5,15-methyltransferase (decarboxylating) subunit CbiT [Clostridium baratii]|uniref:Putative cobalt-precorrin-6Y C(15)-methyltransferase CbiT n=1 Tax=Clostridium baratii TaxID=1561 RepID=A0A174U7J7_9CLOT|nr:precorrin-6Y C5,15-methyltransferase (decarboxylating) subunit CbiT [Clostridium baratii]OPF50321.1 SAM-dependent methyltransferase [Clostridium baratii]OPF53265.1 precorrin-6Y C5,15-methyltransferase (decarboxylating) subunit CbiT [Clostridium baratii]OPF54780.1 precorrin-6Y C5,15-methyltransferase (decarboxylating) subunit CbiT [Clostridium baratii]OPF61242.1 precorrin-6Y C5,15-methyltransferase (decarboxylating) subunit CbiT [Clostridium baratii]CUQ15620.1 putative cobalt-precorrin-6Y C(
MILIKDNEFIRGNCPMTKEDVRALSIWKMDLNNDSKVLDIGSGTGTISVQAAKLAKDGLVYSIEKDDDAFLVSKKNIEKFNCSNINLTKGDAREVLDKYIEEGLKFDSIFIGGSGGGLENIIEKSNVLLKDNGVIVMNFITLNNAYKGIEKAKELNYKADISMVNISKNKGESYMMIANNPIYIVKCVRKEDE